MIKRKNLFLLCFVSLIVFVTIGLQLYWNVKNYSQNKTRVLNEIQIALDNSLETYYAQQIKSNLVLTKKHELANPNQSNSIKTNTVSVYRSSSLVGSVEIEKRISAESIAISATNQPFIIDDLINKVLFSLNRNIDLKVLDSILAHELSRKKIRLNYGLLFRNSNKHMEYYPKKNSDSDILLASKSTYLQNNEKLLIAISNPFLLVLEKIVVEITLSFLLSVSVIWCLFYLLKIINTQKNIDDMKNDFISNITHEFKTPITTISTAIEGIKNFNKINDLDKTIKYLNISEIELKKLEIMVEKLLEIASLEINQLTLQPNNTDLVKILTAIKQKYNDIQSEKSIFFKTNVSQSYLNIDRTHLENVFSNLIENALQYGGYEIIIELIRNDLNTIILFQDNGPGIAAEHIDKIFDKFYRISSGNIHDVKGFGIGLYYSKKIVERHNGALFLDTTSTKTQFKILLPNEFKN